MAWPTPPIRRGKPVCYTLDHDAASLLRAMVPNGKGFGLFISELIRREALERGKRPQLLDTLRGHQTEAGIIQEIDRAVG